MSVAIGSAAESVALAGGWILCAEQNRLQHRRKWRNPNADSNKNGYWWTV